MTVTDELRKLLDERGVRWDYGPSGASSTAFWVNGKELSFSNCRDGLVCSTIFTPAQAITATLGKEPDDAAMLKLHDRMNATLLEYERALGGEKADGAITVPFVAEMHRLLEEAATLEAGTCSIEQTCRERIAGFDAYHDEFACSKCGGDMYEHFNFCPNCGRRIEGGK